MTFETQLIYLVAVQQLGVGRAVGLMTGDAAFHAHGGMLKDKRPALVGMALGARHFISVGKADLPRIKPSVRLMAIHAVDCSLLVFVSEGLVESE